MCSLGCCVDCVAGLKHADVLVACWSSTIPVSQFFTHYDKGVSGGQSCPLHLQTVVFRNESEPVPVRCPVLQAVACILIPVACMLPETALTYTHMFLSVFRFFFAFDSSNLLAAWSQSNCGNNMIRGLTVTSTDNLRLNHFIVNFVALGLAVIFCVIFFDSYTDKIIVL